MTPYYEADGITLYHGRAEDVLPTLPPAYAVITDPPYGIDYDPTHRKNIAPTQHGRVSGDDEPFDPTPLLAFDRLILWGANCYASRLPDSPVWLAWDKVTRNGLNLRISEMELAWTRGIARPQTFRHLWSGAFRDSEQGTKFHPTQKPVALMQWCISRFKPPPGALLLDPYTGSGGLLVAAKLSGCRAIGIELDERHCETAANRLAQGVLFPVGGAA